jgi:tetratricopeptide (TPR) repeat protein
MGLVGVMMALRHLSGESHPSVRSPQPKWMLVFASLAIAIVMAIVVVPVTTSHAVLARARRAGVSDNADRWYVRAATRDPLDPQPLFEAARLELFRAAQQNTDTQALVRAVGLINAAISRDPTHLPIHRLKSRIHLLWAERSRDPSQWTQTVWSARRAVEIYPTDPATHILLAQCLAAQGRATNDVDALDEALWQYQQALAIDDARPAREKIRRLTPAAREAISSSVADLEALLAQRRETTDAD